MIQSLFIRNFALIDNCEIHFSDKLNIISGETGSGKSIIIQALSILLGDRASVEQIRTGMDEAILSAVISLDSNKYITKFLEELHINFENDEIVIRRNLISTGKSRSFINNTQVTSKELNYIASILFDFHGQHDGIGLLKKETHIRYLDGYLKIENELHELQSLYHKLIQTKKELDELERFESDKTKKLELLSFEAEEIETINFKYGEDQELEEKIKILSNLEKIVQLGNDLSSIYSADGGVITGLKMAKVITGQLSLLDKDFSQNENELTDIYYKLEDISSDLNSRLTRYQFDEKQLDTLIERSANIDKIKRKYGSSHDEIMNYYNKITKELILIDNQEERKLELTKDYEKYIKLYSEKANLISEIRKNNKETLEKAIVKELIYLGMSDPSFSIDINFEINESSPIKNIHGNNCKFTVYGIDKVEFIISPNKGEPLKPLAKIASGGELSRIILALKAILGKSDSVRTMIFDEIDVGIGGKVALSVSKKIKEISQDKQIVCITHLPQIAANGSKNFLIQKEEHDKRTFSRINELNYKSKISEIARMLSGSITDKSLNHAEELIKSLENL